jgi:hypothetical protein
LTLNKRRGKDDKSGTALRDARNRVEEGYAEAPDAAGEVYLAL